MKYLDFVDLTYQPKETDLLCTFHVEPDGITLTEAAGGVAAESSVGTWTELTTEMPYVKRLAAHVYDIEGNTIKIAYPIELFEPANMPNILSSVAGNVFGLKALKNLRLLDMKLPKLLTESFKGPAYGLTGIRELLKIPERPLVGTIIKPKLGLSTKDHSRVAYEAWLGGCDIVKDDENLSSQKFNPFDDRLTQTLEGRDKAQSETGERKVYMVNITGDTNLMLERAQKVVDQGGEYIMIDILTCGWAALQTLRDQNFKLVIHAHRAGHAAFTKNTRHGISMRPIAVVARIIGVDQLHVGTVVGKMSETKTEVLDNIDACKAELNGLKPVMPVASGGLYPQLVPALLETFGNDVVIQAGGGVHGHPMGSIAGAKAMRQAVDAVLEDETLEEYAKKHSELYHALKQWTA
ncbi:MAG: type III ribulose-bisphosphate carboxylase [Candidatus Bathyarchaeota archaeon]|nr:type III ribulose-bisphosphate carboxylase [Candidatus Bathyarchaeota archaeon]MDD4325652.1 type III ribulose-bisphosphate carboxylase [Candidatus Bathyarchaeota archaeon]MDI9577681.1 type III ribulose-bisphosphate carboxylase [Thermoproteota archaeon]MDT8782482.1 type III ribulose-bisphosphate carboxylase [Candidatus Bathyarchaeota archaeon]NLD66711.1 type III ribulose-bisphosphate carboxylase [Thermoproteota archaeon]